jgi:hypothetical protein
MKKLLLIALPISLLAFACGGGGSGSSSSGQSTGVAPHQAVQSQYQYQYATPGGQPTAQGQTPGSQYPVEQFPGVPNQNTQNGNQPAPYGSGQNSGGTYYRYYEFSQPDCTTGEKMFTSPTEEGAVEELCTALMSEAQNNGCARQAREELFVNACNSGSSNSGLQNMAGVF